MIRTELGKVEPLGATWDGKGTNFSVFSSLANRVEVCFFDESGRQSCSDLQQPAGGHCWCGYFPDVKPGQRYGYRAHGPWNPACGELCCPAKLLLDPYTKAVDGNITWTEALFPYNYHAPDAPPNGEDTAPFMPKSVVIDPTFDWQGDKPPAIPMRDTVIYELHVKGTTISHPHIPQQEQGTYLGLTHPAMLEYFHDLGVTALELLPVQQFFHRRRLVYQGLRNYWGYDSLAFFAPHNDYSAFRRPGAVVYEFKEMVRRLHAAGLEVILDVVYNHTVEGRITGPLLSFKGLDNPAYYHLDPGEKRKYTDFTGTHNSVNAEHPQVRKLILDSLRYWVGEMHIDGFRFDLAPTLSRTHQGLDRRFTLFREIQQDPMLSKVKLIAEPWDIGEDGYQVGRFPVPWSEWNDQFRDNVRDFWIKRGIRVHDLALRLTGSPNLYETHGQLPQASINFVTCHDGFTLHDLVAYNQKHNLDNQEENRDGLDDNHSWNCGVEGDTVDPQIMALRGRQKRNFLATLILAQGVPMITAGDERGRTQQGNNNAYCQDNAISWIDWDKDDEKLRRFMKGLLELRRQHQALRQSDWFTGSSQALLSTVEKVHVAWEWHAEAVPSKHHPFATWHKPDGSHMHRHDWHHPAQNALMVRFPAPSSDAQSADNQKAQRDLIICINGETEELTFQLPASGKDAGTWKLLVDTADDIIPESDSRETITKQVTLIARSLVLICVDS